MRDPISTELVGVTFPAPLKPRLPENLQVSANEVWAAPARGLSRRKPSFRLTQPWARPASQRRPPVHSFKINGASTAKCTLQTTSIGLAVATTRKFSGLVLLKLC